MEATGALQPIVSHPLVQDRPGRQNRGDREAFRRTLEQHAEAGRADSDADAEAPVRPQLQPRPEKGRKEAQAHHIDVLA